MAANSNADAEKDYLSQLQAVASGVPELVWPSEPQSERRTTTATQACFIQQDLDTKDPLYTRCREYSSPGELIDRAARLTAREPNHKAVCIVENISAPWMSALGTAWNIDPAFFVCHAINPPKSKLWLDRKKWDWDPADSTEAQPAYSHVDGNLEYSGWQKQENLDLDSEPNFFNRHCFESRYHEVMSNTRISYCRVHNGLYLFLVDAPVNMQNTCFRLQARSKVRPWFLYASNRGGLEIPQLLQRSRYSFYESLQSVFAHSWQVDLIFEIEAGAVLPPHPLLHLWASSVLRTNLRHLDGRIKHVSFEELRNPRIELNGQLHDLRHDLNELKVQASDTKQSCPKRLDEYFGRFESIKVGADDVASFPISHLQATVDQATQLEALLMDSFQLLMSSMSVQDSQVSIEQGRRGQRLTLLAFVYVPFSFVTGLFGMNVKQINGATPEAWTVLVALVVTLWATATFFSIVWYIEWRRKKRQGMAKHPGAHA